METRKTTKDCSTTAVQPIKSPRLPATASVAPQHLAQEQDGIDPECQELVKTETKQNKRIEHKN